LKNRAAVVQFHPLAPFSGPDPQRIKLSAEYSESLGKLSHKCQALF
jgi:hypothetical protein